MCFLVPFFPGSFYWLIAIKCFVSFEAHLGDAFEGLPLAVAAGPATDTKRFFFVSSSWLVFSRVFPPFPFFPGSFFPGFFPFKYFVPFGVHLGDSLKGLTCEPFLNESQHNVPWTPEVSWAPRGRQGNSCAPGLSSTPRGFRRALGGLWEQLKRQPMKAKEQLKHKT